MPPLVTASIVTFRTPLDTLKAAVESLHRCTLTHEIVIADNSVDDAYFSALQQLNIAPCIRAERNGGYGYGHNLALTHLPVAPYHLVLNPDIVIHAGCLETLVEKMEKNPGIGLAVPKIYSKEGRLQHLNKRDPTVYDLFLRRFVPRLLHRIPPIWQRITHYVMMDEGYDHSYEVPYASGCFMLFRRPLFDAVGGFDERYFLHFEDADITRQIRARSRVMYFPESSVTHLWTRNSYASLKFTLITLNSAYLYFKKWGWRWW